jgi:hypothetical protein
MDEDAPFGAVPAHVFIEYDQNDPFEADLVEVLAHDAGDFMLGSGSALL